MYAFHALGVFIGLLVLLYHIVCNCNYTKIVRQFNQGNYSVELKTRAEEEKFFLVKQSDKFGKSSNLQNRINSLDSVVNFLSLCEGNFIKDCNHERISFFLCLRCLMQNDFDEAETHLKHFRSRFPLTDLFVRLLECVWEYKQGSISFAFQIANEISASTKNPFCKHICSCILNNKEIQFYVLPKNHSVPLRLISPNRKENFKKLLVVLGGIGILCFLIATFVTTA